VVATPPFDTDWNNLDHVWSTRYLRTTETLDESSENITRTGNFCFSRIGPQFMKVTLRSTNSREGLVMTIMLGNHSKSSIQASEVMISYYEPILRSTKFHEGIVNREREHKRILDRDYRRMANKLKEDEAEYEHLQMDHWSEDSE
ncbi:19583_t:CDS:2, partial [Gigaspora rosea]